MVLDGLRFVQNAGVKALPGIQFFVPAQQVVAGNDDVRLRPPIDQCGAVGGIAVMVVMPLYYGLAGLLADVMLVFTITMLMAGLAAFGATLTLPGIAGIVLTIGMSVDANVLIFERIREEIRQGLKPLEAVAVGFDRATISIVDSNLTTIIAAAILYQFGTGPVRGFAVTLSLGIVASMFTAIFVSRTAFGLWLGGNDGKKLSI